MKKTYTKECTPVYFALPDSEHVPEFTRRKINPIAHFHQRFFNYQDHFTTEDIKNGLEHLLAVELEEISKEEKKKKPRNRVPLPSWEERVNRKRNHILKCYQNRPNASMSEIAKITKTDRGTVKRIIGELLKYGRVDEYHYNFVKDREDEEALNRTIEEDSEGFMTASLLKRKHPMFSKPKIFKALHESNMSYRLMPKRPKNPEEKHPNTNNICRVISHIAQAWCDCETTLLYCDEMKFPLFQTAEKRWMPREETEQEQMAYNQRPDLGYTLNAIALCSVDKFEAVQVFQRDVNAQDFLYFINNAISQLPRGRHYTVICDNAGWHHANDVTRSTASYFLCYNEPYIFQLNIIENAFSFIRHLFRHRPIVHSLIEEARLIVNAFFDEDNPKRFQGLRRNHLKVLLEFLEKYSD